MHPLKAAIVAAALFAPVLAQSGWPAYGHDPGSARYSPLTQIAPANVSNLGVAWTYNTGFTDRSFEVTPLVVNGVMYVSTPTEQVVALDAATGRQLWKYDPHEPRTRVSRGVSYWPGDADHAPRIVLATSGDGRLIELEAKTGAPVSSFGVNGSVRAADGLGPGRYGFTSPPAIYRDLLIVGPDLQEGPSHGLPGTVSAFNAITGKLAWRFYLTPRPGQLGNETWGPGGWKDRSGPAAWNPISVDERRGLVFVNTANPADSYYGADRPGTNLFANSLVVLDAATGKLRWYFQLVHHDLADEDTAGAPVLIQAGPDHTPAVATTAKTALLFMLNRETGKPIFGVTEKPVAPSDVPGEHPSPTQPFPDLPPPLAIQSATLADVSTVTPDSEAYCRKLFATYKNYGPYTTFHLEPTVTFPSSIGGPNWGGMSYDPKLGYIIINVSDMGNIGQMFPAGKMPARHFRFRPPAGGDAGAARMAGARPRPRERMPYGDPDVGRRFVDESGYPCQQPPWGELIAVNTRTGRIAWQVPLGQYSDLSVKGVKPTGAPNIGGGIVTASGLIFIGATPDGDFRAFDASNGKQLWESPLDGYGLATPATYSVAGKQYVAVAVGGPGSLGGVHHTVATAPDRLVVFALGAKRHIAAPPIASLPSRNAAAIVNPAQLPAGPGKDVVAQACTLCHSLATVTGNHASLDGWTATVNEMVGRGAPLSSSQISEVAAYLAKHFGTQ